MTNINTIKQCSIADCIEQFVIPEGLVGDPVNTIGSGRFPLTTAGMTDQDTYETCDCQKALAQIGSDIPLLGLFAKRSHNSGPTIEDSLSALTREIKELTGKKRFRKAYEKADRLGDAVHEFTQMWSPKKSRSSFYRMLLDRGMTALSLKSLFDKAFYAAGGLDDLWKAAGEPQEKRKANWGQQIAMNLILDNLKESSFLQFSVNELAALEDLAPLDLTISVGEHRPFQTALNRIACMYDLWKSLRSPKDLYGFIKDYFGEKHVASKEQMRTLLKRVVDVTDGLTTKEEGQTDGLPAGVYKVIDPKGRIGPKGAIGILEISTNGKKVVHQYLPYSEHYKTILQLFGDTPVDPNLANVRQNISRLEAQIMNGKNANNAQEVKDASVQLMSLYETEYPNRWLAAQTALDAAQYLTETGRDGEAITFYHYSHEQFEKTLTSGDVNQTSYHTIAFFGFNIKDMFKEEYYAATEGLGRAYWAVGRYSDARSIFEYVLSINNTGGNEDLEELNDYSALGSLFKRERFLALLEEIRAEEPKSLQQLADPASVVRGLIEPPHPDRPPVRPEVLARQARETGGRIRGSRERIEGRSKRRGK